MHPGIDVSVVELFVEDKKKLVLLNDGGNFLRVRPRGRLEVLLRQLGEGHLVKVGYFETISIVNL